MSDNANPNLGGGNVWFVGDEPADPPMTSIDMLKLVTLCLASAALFLTVICAILKGLM